MDGNPLSFIDPFGLRDLTREELIEISNGMTEPWMEVIDAGAGGTAAAAKIIIKDAAKKCVKKAAKKGETKFTSAGRRAHQQEPLPDGFERDVKIPGTRKRMDGYNPETKEIIEIKPNNPRAIKRGENQAKDYCNACDNSELGTGHTARPVQTYDPSNYLE